MREQELLIENDRKTPSVRTGPRIFCRGQIVAEYFILFAVIGLLTLIAFSRFDNKVATILTDFFTQAASKIGQ